MFDKKIKFYTLISRAKIKYEIYYKKFIFRILIIEICNNMDFIQNMQKHAK
jgi:hypothetical protein